MAARARVEWLSLGEGMKRNRVLESVINGFHGSIMVSVSPVATVGSDRPVAPIFIGGYGGNHGYALVRCFDAPIIISWGLDPSANINNGIMLLPDEQQGIAMRTGEMISFIEVT